MSPTLNRESAVRPSRNKRERPENPAVDADEEVEEAWRDRSSHWLTVASVRPHWGSVMVNCVRASSGYTEDAMCKPALCAAEAATLKKFALRIVWITEEYSEKTELLAHAAVWLAVEEEAVVDEVSMVIGPMTGTGPTTHSPARHGNGAGVGRPGFKMDSVEGVTDTTADAGSLVPYAPEHVIVYVYVPAAEGDS